MFVLVSQVLSFRLKKHTSKNVADTTFKFAISWSWVSDFSCYKILIRINSMQGWTATTRHGVTKKEAQKDKSIQEICLERTYS